MEWWGKPMSPRGVGSGIKWNQVELSGIKWKFVVSRNGTTSGWGQDRLE
jgi:hypothetical protein